MDDDFFEEDEDPRSGNFIELLQWADQNGWFNDTANIIGQLNLRKWEGRLVHATSVTRWNSIQKDGFFKTEIDENLTLGKAAYFFSGSNPSQIVEALSSAETYYTHNPRWPDEKSVIVQGPHRSDKILDLREEDGHEAQVAFMKQVTVLQKAYFSDPNVWPWRKVLSQDVFECGIWTAFSKMYPELDGILANLPPKTGPLRDKKLQIFASIKAVPSVEFRVHTKF